MAKNETPRKAKAEKQYTRAQAEKLLSGGADPEQFAKHGNYHVRRKAWTKMGMPLPEDAEERAKFLASIHVKEPELKPVLLPTDDFGGTDGLLNLL